MKAKKDKTQKVIKGENISSGYAIGKAFVYKDVLTRSFYFYSIDRKDVKKELARIKAAFNQVFFDVKKLEKHVKGELGKEQSDIFKVHAEILKDKTLLKDIEKELKNELVNAEHVVRNVFRKWANKFKVSENDVVKSKAHDLEDLSRKILCYFMNCTVNLLEKIPGDRIIVAKRLLPSDTVRIKRKNVKGLIVEQGSTVSHSAIIARSLGIPAVTAIKNAVKIIKPGEDLIVDGGKGMIIQNPTKEEVKTYKKIIQSKSKTEAKLIKRAKHIAKTKENKTIKVYANVASKEDAETAHWRGCDGVGLLRIEQLYMSSNVLPDEKYLVEHLREILKPVKKKLITIRLLDIGADKNLPYIEIEDESSPVLGLRGVRLLLKYKNLLRTQFKATLILAQEQNIRVLVPMVSFPGEMEEIRDIAQVCQEEIKSDYGRKKKKLKIGAMIETPAAVENIKKIARVSDSISIGTNDLIQYFVAAGRDNPSVSEYYEQGEKLVMKYIKRIVKIADRYGIECSLCGEMAGELNWVQPLVKAGIRVLSVSPYSVPLVKDKIRKI
jgi:phosphotransferase system enzyme I (PtsI)